MGRGDLGNGQTCPQLYQANQIQSPFLTYLYVVYTLCLKKNDNDVAHYNFNAH